VHNLSLGPLHFLITRSAREYFGNVTRITISIIIIIIKIKKVIVITTTDQIIRRTRQCGGILILLLHNITEQLEFRCQSHYSLATAVAVVLVVAVVPGVDLGARVAQTTFG